MPQPYSDQHSSYLANYMRSGQGKIIGRGARTVLALRKDGSTLAVEISVDEASLDGDRHFLGVLAEVSQQQDSQQSILQETRGVINSLAMPAVVIDRTGIIQAFNNMAEGLLGYSMVDVLGEKVQMLMNDDDASRHDTYLSNYLTTGNAKVIGSTRRVLAKTIDGVLVPVNLSISKSVNPDDPKDVLFTGMLNPVNEKGGAELKSYSAAERNEKQMNSAGENTVKRINAFKDFGSAEDPNTAHRTSMEDAWVVIDEPGDQKGHALLGLYDGHGGSDAANFVMTRLHLFFLRYLKDPTMSPSVCFSKAYLAVHEAMGSEIGKSGCTAVNAYVQGSGSSRKLHVANVGDSRALLVRNGQAMRLTKDHKPNDPEEKKAVEAKGGKVFNNRVSGILAVSRSLGDYRAEKYVSRVPTTSSHDLTAADSHLLLACDGVFDVCSDQDVADIIVKGAKAGHSASKIARSIVSASIQRGTTDNVSVCLSTL
jgi:protein phosphatase PTC1